MSSEWQSYQLGELFELTNGFAFKGSDFISSGVPVIKIKNVKPNSLLLGDLAYVDTAVADKRPDKQLKRGDILITMSGNRMDGSRDTWVGKVAYFDIPGRYMLNQRVGVLRPKEGVQVDRKCCAYFLSSDEFQDFFIAVATSSGGQANLSPSQILGEKISLPPLEEQERIASLLTALDDRITLLRETNATLEAIAQALFKSWFVDFDPVRAKMEGRTPDGMDEATAALFPDGFETSELGEVPRGWRYSTAGESFVLTMGQSPPGDTYNESGEGLAFYQGRTDFGFRFPTQRVYCSAPTRYAEPGDTLVSVRAPVGDVNMALERCCIGRGVASVRHPSGFRGFAFYAMRGLGERFKTFDSEGTVFGSISKKDFHNLPVVIAPEAVLRAYDEVTSPIDQRIVENEVMLRTVTALRDTLLPRLISGQLRLPEAQTLFEEST